MHLRGTALAIFGLAESERIPKRPVINRELYRTSQDEEDEPVHDQDGPEDRDVEDIEPTARERDGDSASSLVPELELWQATDEGPEFLKFEVPVIQWCGDASYQYTSLAQQIPGGRRQTGLHPYQSTDREHRALIDLVEFGIAAKVSVSRLLDVSSTELSSWGGPTLWILDVWAVTAAKGVWSVSMLSIAMQLEGRGDVRAALSAEVLKGSKYGDGVR
ncbi:hypothetical protein O1611_g8632 [Lasiodiplodia mahajangana]|uniref:Uncharacterized protein n=1 Tax=Lasiodiplodia mahajangana TaxID=1108764 RepID=A0ACC2JCS8_9PEZI|nr:hypothetical protein O1611_g8632 [Lasiodiplodia mahajangana]